MKKENINEGHRTDYCGGYKKCNVFVKKFDTKDKECQECYDDAMIGIQQSLSKEQEQEIREYLLSI